MTEHYTICIYSPSTVLPLLYEQAVVSKSEMIENMAKVNQESEKSMKAEMKVTDFIKKEEKKNEESEKNKETDVKKENITTETLLMLFFQ